jgi:hypothetical protein
MKRILFGSLLLSSALYAHHGVASIGVAGLEGPGAPIETTASTPLPEGKYLGYMKVDYVNFKTFTAARDDEMKRHNYWMYGLGYGFTSYFSGYIFAPYYVKTFDNGEETSGFHDINLMGVLGFAYDDGFKLVPKKESLDDMEDWHFSTFFNVSLPTGSPSQKRSDGTYFDPSVQLSFGKPSFMLGMSATKWFGNRWTFIADTSYNTFLEYTYPDGTSVKYADEIRLNTALTYRLYTNAESKFRVDFNIEANYLNLGRDKVNGVYESATGGHILYDTIGFRIYKGSISAGFGIKTPMWTDLNEESEQQGAEGKEDYRALFTFSTLF